MKNNKECSECKKVNECKDFNDIVNEIMGSSSFEERKKSIDEISKIIGLPNYDEFKSRILNGESIESMRDEFIEKSKGLTPTDILKGLNKEGVSVEISEKIIKFEVMGSGRKVELKNDLIIEYIKTMTLKNTELAIENKKLKKENEKLKEISDKILEIVN